MNVSGTKALALVLMAFITLLSSMLPLYVRRQLKGRLEGKKAQAALSCCLCFGGGVLLATVFLHLIPEARLLMQQAMENGFVKHTNYPMGELVVCAGFFLIYIIEHVVHTCSMHEQGGGHSHSPPKPTSQDSTGKEQVPLKTVANDYTKEDLADKNCMQNLNDHNDVEVNSKEAPAAPADDNAKQGMPTLKAMIFVVAFSFHSIMEGLALGLVSSSRDVWFLFAALLAHKIVIAFCMAMELLEVGVTKLGFFASMIIFSLASPIGGLIGTLIVSFANNESPGGFVTTTILQGISAGTILYVTFCEVLERERNKPDNGTLCTISLIIGFIAMAILQIFDDEAYLQGEQVYLTTVLPTLSPFEDL